MRRVALLPAVLLLPWLSATAQPYPTEQKIWQMEHTSWTGREGAPRDISVLTQTPDGILWIGSGRGLYTFDGFAFQAVELASDVTGELRKPVWQMITAKDGSLWLAASSGGAVHLDGIRVSTFTKVKGEADLRNLGSLQEDNQGTIWCVFNDQNPAFLGSDGLWHTIAVPLRNGAHIQNFLVDSTGARWLIQQNTLYRQDAGDAAFAKTSLHVNGPASIWPAPDRGVWIKGSLAGRSRSVSGATLLHHVDAGGHVLHSRLIPGNVRDLLVQQDGSAWLAIEGYGLRKLNLLAEAKLSSQKDEDNFRREDGLTSNSEYTLIKDHDGNLWAGGSRGLDRFTPATLVRALRPQSTGVWSTCMDAGGDVLAGGEYLALFRLHHGATTKVQGVRELNGLFCDGPDTLLLDGDGAAKVVGDHLERLPLLPGHSGFWDDYIFSSIYQEDPQTLYAWATGANEDSLWVYQHRRWRRIGGEDHFGRVISIGADAEKQVFFGRRDGKIDYLQGSGADVLSVDNGGIGTVGGFTRTTEGFVAFGRTGIALRIDLQFRALPFADPLVGTLVTGLVQSQKGDWWLNSAAGIVRLPQSEVDRAIQNPAHKLTGEQISDPTETAPLKLTISGGSAHRDRLGRLWFGSMEGVFSVDCDRLPVLTSPRLKIVSVAGDNRPIAANHIFPAGLQTLRIQYLGVQLTDPADVLYRYRLEGHDAEWQDVGTRREAVYTSLKAGTYRFAVMASMRGGRWTPPIYSAPFVLSPRLYETFWFQALAILAAAATVSLVFRLRVLHLSRLHQAQAEARAEERIRISRNLHDTLLQGLQGLILRFESVRKLIPLSAPVQDAFESALLRAEQLVVESRTRVIQLRMEAPDTRQLPSALQSVADMLWQKRAPAFSVVVHGAPRALTSTVYVGVYEIAAAAIANAFLHSSASTLRIGLYYDPDSFKLHCHDDGVGMPETVARNGRSGHWGIIGMRENAREMGAHFDLRSSPGAGTQVEVTLLAAVAYEK